jgi:predicted molibdopterin-dependent oxidoreductase YjgC
MTVAAEKLAACNPNSFGMIISPDSTNEDLYVAQKFAREVIGSNNIDTSARRYHGGSFAEYLKLFSIGGTLDDLRRASVIVAIGLDTRYGRSVMGVELRQAMRRGALIVTIHPRRHSLSVIADIWLKPSSAVASLLKDLIALIAKPGVKVTASDAKDKLDKAAAIIRGSGSTVILVGSEFSHEVDSGDIWEAIGTLAKAAGARVLPLPAAGNLVGSIRMGTYPELLPGGGPISGIPFPWNSLVLDMVGGKLAVLYLIGEDPAPYRNMADFIISQNGYPSEDAGAADLVFPAALFTESEGTIYNQEGRLLGLHKCVDPPGNALPDWQILSRLATRMGKPGFDYATVEDVQAEITSVVTGFDDGHIEPLPTVTLVGVNIDPLQSRRVGDHSLAVSMVPDEHLFRGYPLSRWVGGMRIIQPVDVLYINPADADRLGIAHGGKAVVSADGFERVWSVIVDDTQSSGMARVSVDADEWERRHDLSIAIRKHNG